MCLAFVRTDILEHPSVHLFQLEAGESDKYQMLHRISILWAKHSLVSLIVVNFLGHFIDLNSGT